MSLPTQSAFTIFFRISFLYIALGEKVLMAMCSHGDLLASQPAQSPGECHSNLLRHTEVFMTFQLQHLEADCQMGLVNFPEVWAA